MRSSDYRRDVGTMPQDATPSLNKATPKMGGSNKVRTLVKEYLNALQPSAVVTLAVLCWYLIITRGPLFFLALFLVHFLGYLTVRRWGGQYFPNWIHCILAFSIAGSAAYGFYQLNESNTRTRHADVLFCGNYRADAGMDSNEQWWIHTQHDNFVVFGGKYDGQFLDDDAAAHRFKIGTVYRITYHGGPATDRYMTGAVTITGSGVCGSNR